MAFHFRLRDFYSPVPVAGPKINFHVLVASHPQLDAAISSVPSDVVDPVRGFSGRIDLAESEEDAKIWLPHLAKGRNSALTLIRQNLRGPVDVCPVLPLSQRDPRAADDLIAEFESEFLYQEWDVDPRNLVYAIEDDPLDIYRTITKIFVRYSGVFAKVTDAHVVLSPSGNKVLAIGALMAALEHDLPVRYVEAVSYSADWVVIEKADPEHKPSRARLAERRALPRRGHADRPFRGKSRSRVTHRGAVEDRAVTPIFSSKLDRLHDTIELAARADHRSLAAAMQSCAKTPVLAVGSGGSAIAAEFLATCRASLGHAPTTVITPMSYVLEASGSLGSPAWLFSASGENQDIQAALAMATGENVASLDILTSGAEGTLARPPEQ